MLDLEYISELFDEAQDRARKREWYGLGFQIVRRLRPAGPIEHCGICGLPWWWHERWGCRTTQPMPKVQASAASVLAHRRTLDRRNRIRRERRKLAHAAP